MEKVHATVAKGIVGGFEYTVLQRNLKLWHAGGHGHMIATVKRKATKVGSTTKVVSVRNSDDRIPQLLFGTGRVLIFRQLFSNSCMSDRRIGRRKQVN